MHIPCLYATLFYEIFHSSTVLNLSALRLPDRNCFMDESMSIIERMLQLLLYIHCMLACRMYLANFCFVYYLLTYICSIPGVCLKSSRAAQHHTTFSQNVFDVVEK